VHLKAADVPRANAFYRDALGFEEQAQIPSAAFLAAGGYHHHIGLNSWQSAGGAPAPDSAPGLRRIEFELAGADALARLERTLADAPSEPAFVAGTAGELSLRDPDGELLSFSARET
jgi:catechol 2,3-dioxygenase